MSTTIRVTVSLLAVVLLAAPAALLAVEPTVYGSFINYAGKGKHPKSGVSGLIIDSRASGRKFICYNYSIITSTKVKGQISGVVDRITASGVERLGSFGNMNVLDFSDLPIPPDNTGDPCAPEFPDGPTSFNFGFATDCLETFVQLEPDDIVRWTLNFEKGAKLKGANAAVSVFGSVLPASAFSSGAARVEQARDWALELQRRSPANR